MSQQINMASELNNSRKVWSVLIVSMLAFTVCSDSRLEPYLMIGAGSGELFIVRNMGAFIRPYGGSHGLHGTTAAIEYAVLSLKVERIMVCGHGQCGGIRAAYEGVPDKAALLKG
ncbi:carbonic anhydrase [Polaromonas sp. CG_9.7]|nr:carbonic anhydrase [Polaromonas sp. CG_9.7]MBG6115237.1 carbonic anhydrase [Polaromonas sp. CG_9.2]MDH6183462.1 carbonic anhydrase [Polaromonas sp. CG_23.6]